MFAEQGQREPGKTTRNKMEPETKTTNRLNRYLVQRNKNPELLYLSFRDNEGFITDYKTPFEFPIHTSKCFLSIERRKPLDFKAWRATRTGFHHFWVEGFTIDVSKEKEKITWGAKVFNLEEFAPLMLEFSVKEITQTDFFKSMNFVFREMWIKPPTEASHRLKEVK
jgi:hypothetical protein